MIINECGTCRLSIFPRNTQGHGFAHVQHTWHTAGGYALVFETLAVCSWGGPPAEGVHARVCVRACVCVCMCVCVGAWVATNRDKSKAWVCVNVCVQACL